MARSDRRNATLGDERIDTPAVVFMWIEEATENTAASKNMLQVLAGLRAQ